MDNEVKDLFIVIIFLLYTFLNFANFPQLAYFHLLFKKSGNILIY